MGANEDITKANEEAHKNNKQLSNNRLKERVNSSTVKDGGFEFDIDTYEENDGTFSVDINDREVGRNFKTIAEAASYGRRRASDMLYKKIHG